MLLNGHLLNGKALSLSHMRSNINMAFGDMDFDEPVWNTS